MSTPELLNDLRVTIQCIQKELAGSDEEKVKEAHEAYHELLDGFYEEYHGLMAPQQYKAAKNDPEYFLRLIELAYHHEKQERVDKQGEQSIS